MSLESVLSEILGVPCGNVKFTRESSSNVLVGDEYVHGLIKCNLTFTTTKPIKEYPAKNKFGSLGITSMLAYNITKYQYDVVLFEGEETSRIVRAITDELCC